MNPYLFRVTFFAKKGPFLATTAKILQGISHLGLIVSKLKVPGKIPC